MIGVILNLELNIDMKQAFLVVTVMFMLAGCADQSGNSADEEKDSVSTAPVTDPSYNPKVEADSARKHMNLDSTQQEDSVPPR